MLKCASRVLLAGCIAAISCAPALAQVCQSYWTAAYRCMNGCGGCPANSATQGAQSLPAGPSPAEIERAQRIAASRQYNDEGNAAYSRRDYSEAVRLYQLSSDIDPGDTVVANNLSNARARLQVQNDSKVASARIGAMVQTYVNAQSPADSTGNLDFDQGSLAPRPGVNAGAKASQSLDFGDPMVVDARNVPSDLPKTVADAIESGYSSAPAGVSDRVRKGFQAVAAHDWKAARAWFEDALNRDPKNPGLKRLTELAEFTLTRKSKSKAAKRSSASGTLQLPESSDMQFLFGENNRQPAHPGVALQLPTDSDLALPKESDVEFLFPGLPALEAKALSDYTEKHWIDEIRTDPQLIHPGRETSTKRSNRKVTQ